MLFLTRYLIVLINVCLETCVVLPAKRHSGLMFFYMAALFVHKLLIILR